MGEDEHRAISSVAVGRRLVGSKMADQALLLGCQKDLTLSREGTFDKPDWKGM